MTDAVPTPHSMATLHNILHQLVQLALSGDADPRSLLLLAELVRTAIAASGGWFFAAYFFVYTVLTALCLPGGSVLMLVGGACMGFVECLFLSNAACTLGAWMTFAGARMGWVWAKGSAWKNTLGAAESGTDMANADEANAGSPFQLQSPTNGALRTHERSHKAKRIRWLATIEARLANRQIPFLLSMRLAPVVPFAAFNILAAFTSLGHWRFLWTSFAGMLPGTWLYVNAGSQLGNVSSVQELLGWEVMASVAGLAVVPWVLQSVLKGLQQK